VPRPGVPARTVAPSTENAAVADVDLSDPVTRVLSALTTRPASLGGSRLVCIDGPAGSGKTTLAERLRAATARTGSTASVVHMDDLYEDWEGLAPDRAPALEERVLTQLLRPLASGRPARWQQYDWHRQRFDRWHDLPPVDVLILEGCGSGARAYAGLCTLLVWVEAPREVRIDRGVARDGPGVLQNWLAWMDLEQAYFASQDTAARADITLRNGETVRGPSPPA
jgi:uridine kinase